MPFTIFNYLKNKGLLSIEPSITITRSIRINESNEVVISGDKASLIMLADYVISVALSNAKGAHIHLDDSNFFDDSNVEIIIEKTE